ncbi:MAG TPA: AraC family transcriptional regulator [Solimonas sp.]|nr:AraC family transcriptional regulator [Solimonas sp.]
MDTLSQILDDIRLRGGEFRDLQLYAPWAFRLETPGLASFHIVTQGSCWLLREGAEPLRLDAGDLVVLPGGAAHRVQDSPETPGEAAPDLSAELGSPRREPHRLGTAGPLARLLSGRFSFEVELARPLVGALPPLLLHRGQGAGPPVWLRIGLQFLADERSQNRPAQQAVINRLADILLIQVLRNHISELPEGSGNWLLALRDRALSAALSAMHREPQRPWTVPELAEIASLSRSAFAERFNQVLGQPPLAYLTEHRMRLAAWQLRHGSQPVCRIAEQVGYNSETAFSQAFKRSHGVSPSGYRKT